MFFRTTDLAKWGAGKGAKLTSVEIDENFWEALSRIISLENNPVQPKQISNITLTGSQLVITLDDGTEFGPYTVPIAVMSYRGEWVAGTLYYQLDLVRVSGQGLYLVMRDHTAAATFDPNATNPDGALYSLIMPGTGSVEEAPIDGNVYARKDGAWVIFATTVTWNDIAGKPTTFPPSTHYHTLVSLTDTPSAYGTDGQLLSVNPTGDGLIWVDRTAATGTGVTDAPSDNSYYVRRNTAWEVLPATDWGNILNKPAAFTPEAHSHAWGEITAKPTEFPPIAHGHNWNDIAGVVEEAPLDNTQYARINGAWTPVTVSQEVAEDKHTYWRIYIRSNNGDVSTRLAEIEFKAATTSADQSTGGTALASGAAAGQPATNAFDNDPATYWQQDVAADAWIQYQFTSAVAVSVITLQAGPTLPGTAPNTFDVQYSDDGINWTTVASFNDFTWTAGEIKSFAVDETSIVEYTGNFTLRSRFNKMYIRSLNNAATNLNVLAAADTLRILVGYEIHHRTAGDGKVTIVPAAGVTVNPPFGQTLVTPGKGATITLKKVAENEWDLIGHTEAAV